MSLRVGMQQMSLKALAGDTGALLATQGHRKTGMYLLSKERSTLEYWVAVTMSSADTWVLGLGLRPFMRLVTKLALDVRGSARVSRARPAMTKPGGPIQNRRVRQDDSASLVNTT